MFGAGCNCLLIVIVVISMLSRNASMMLGFGLFWLACARMATKGPRLQLPPHISSATEAYVTDAVFTRRS